MRMLLPLLAAATLAACSRPAATPEPVRSVRAMTIAGDSGGGGLHEYAAEIRARTESQLSFRVGGKLVRRGVDVGDAVKAGQVLAQLDPQDLRLGQQAAQAALQAARINQEQAAADFKRFKDLRDQGFISAAELERRQTALASAQAELDQAKAQAGVQANQARYAVLLADVPGVITGVEAEPGAVVAAGTPVLRLAHDGPRDAVFSVPEDQLASLRSRQGVKGGLQVRLWGQDGTLPATVREVAAAADPVTRTFLVKADIGVGPARLGQTATALLALPAKSGVIRLPLTAVMEQQGKTSVWLVDKGSMAVKVRPIEVAGAEGNTVLVGGGLAAGDTVVTAGVHVLTAGQKVKFYIEPRPASVAVDSR